MEGSPSKDAIKAAIMKGEVISYHFSYITGNHTESLLSALNVILEEKNKMYMKEPAGFFVREFVSNANKSNLKRVHFQSLGLDMKDSDTYYEGMKTFAKDFREKLELYNRDIEKQRLYTQVEFQIKDNNLAIIVKNSGIPTPQESAKVQSYVEKSKTMRDPAEAFLMIGDMSEGAGLGVITGMMMLRNLGLDEKSFSFFADRQNKETVAKITIPLDTIMESQIEELSDVIVKEIELMPTFPEKISRLQELLSAEEIDFAKVADVIQSDYALTAELLKIVNSAQYMLPQKVSNITNAISLVGIKGLKNLIISYGAQELLKRHFGRFDRFWDHAYRCASYAYYIAKEYKMKDIIDDAYIGGILHDIGKIILVHKYPKLIDKIKGFCSDKGIKNNMIEKLAVGSSHAKIGAEMARRWNFPEFIISSIANHHNPLLAPDENRKIVFVVYMADMLTHCHDYGFSFAGLEPKVLEAFGIKSEKEFFDLEKILNDYYYQQQSKGRETSIENG